MNIYTLTFSNKRVEEQYQKQQPSLYKQAITIDVLCIVYLIYTLLMSLINGNYNGLQVRVGIASIIIGLILNGIVFTQKRSFKACFFTANILIMFQQFSAVQTYPPQQAFNLGNNVMIIHGMIVYLSDFTYGAIQICSHLIVTTSIAIAAQDPNINYTTFFASSIGLHSIWIWVHYTWSKSQRTTFLLSLQQTQLETIIPQLKIEAFCLFTFDKQHLRYNIKITNMFRNVNELVNYLRKFKIKHKSYSLEHYLLNNKLQNTCIEAINQKQIINVEIDELYSAERTFFMRLIHKRSNQLRKV